MNFFSRKRNIIIAVVFVVVGISIVMVSRGRSFFTSVPDEFSQARLQGALISQNIVDLSNQLPDDLARVNDLDRQANFPDAIIVTNDLVRRSQEIRDKATDLSKELEVMTRTLPDIKSETARQAALDSVTSRVTLITRLINYSGYLGQLLDILRNKFAGNPSKDHYVSKLIDQINSEVSAINSFNTQATEAMNRFDSIIKAGR